MNAHQEKQLIEDVEALKKLAAAQAPHNFLLLALAKRGVMSHHSNIAQEIDQIPVESSLDADETRRQAKQLLLLYFPRRDA